MQFVSGLRLRGPVTTFTCQLHCPLFRWTAPAFAKDFVPMTIILGPGAADGFFALDEFHEPDRHNVWAGSIEIAGCPLIFTPLTTPSRAASGWSTSTPR